MILGGVWVTNRSYVKYTQDMRYAIRDMSHMYVCASTFQSVDRQI